MHANIYVHQVEIALRDHTASNGLQKKIRSSEASNSRKWPSGVLVVTSCQAKRPLFAIIIPSAGEEWRTTLLAP